MYLCTCLVHVCMYVHRPKNWTKQSKKTTTWAEVSSVQKLTRWQGQGWLWMPYLTLGKAILRIAAAQAMLTPCPASVLTECICLVFIQHPPPTPPPTEKTWSRSKNTYINNSCQTNTHHLLSQYWQNRGTDTFSQKTSKKNAQYWLTLIPTSYQNATDFSLLLSFSLGTTTAARRVVHSSVSILMVVCQCSHNYM